MRLGPTCSVCKKTGHIKTVCPELAKKSERTQTTQKAVVVRVIPDASRSAHVVNLKGADPVEREQVHAFREKMEKIHSVRETIDLAALVKAANEKADPRTALYGKDKDHIRLPELKQQTQKIAS